MAEELARNRYGVVIAHDQPRYLELGWLPSTSNMSDEDFMTGLMMLASEAEAVGTRAILVDATHFGHGFEDFDNTMARRDQQVIPRYNEAGVERFAFLMPPDFGGPTAESGAEPQVDGPTAGFSTQWFIERTDAVDWLAG